MVNKAIFITLSAPAIRSMLLNFASFEIQSKINKDKSQRTTKKVSFYSFSTMWGSSEVLFRPNARFV